MFALRASAKLALNQTNQAFTDIMTVFRVANALSDEPTLNGRVCRRRTIQAGLQPVWEGLGQRKWSDAQLAELEEWLQKVDALAYYRAAMREERASEITEISGWRLHRFAGQSFFPPPSPGLRGFILDYMPDGWYYQNQLFLSRLYDDYAISLVDPETHRVFPDRLPDTSRLDQLIGPLAPGQPGELVHDFSKDAFRPFRFFSQFNFPGNSSFSIGFSFFQTRVDQFRIACALERFRLSHGEYPQTLEALVPGLIKILPDDVTTGGRLKYHRNENGTFSLYSVGWNMKDDLGKIASGDDMAFLTQGDWVWPAYPAK
jgi:hypothetical protein